jgi:hypothetical protein
MVIPHQNLRYRLCHLNLAHLAVLLHQLHQWLWQL